MKALRLVRVGQPLELQDVPVPPVGENDVLVRVQAAGICHTDAHYRAGVSPVRNPPLTLGHEIAGIVEQTGRQVASVRVGERVCVHYLVTCGNCIYCTSGSEQFCPSGQMLGKHRNGGYAEYVVIPARNAVPLPKEIPFSHGAILMCSSATAFHALRKGRLQPGETVAVFGIGGLGLSAVQLAHVCGALDVYAVDINPAKLQVAERYGAVPVNASQSDPVLLIQRLTNGRGVDVAVEMIGLPETMRQAVQVLARFGRAVWVGISGKPVVLDSYREVLGKEAEIIGSDDHLLHELPTLIEFARRGTLDLSQIVTANVPLHAKAVNSVLDRLETFQADIRTVITL
jgi:2-desacetyl-2-hydroxyethyl bacteriochlorophyllide A dehydrogenase